MQAAFWVLQEHLARKEKVPSLIFTTEIVLNGALGEQTRISRSLSVSSDAVLRDGVGGGG